MYPVINVFGMSIPMYFVFLSLVFTLVVPVLLYRAKKLYFSQLDALDVYIFVVLGAFIGARLFYVFYQDFYFYSQNPLKVFSFWEGGYVFYGGLLGGITSLYGYSYFKKQSFEEWLNFCVPILSFGYAVGRISCFLSGCCYGKKMEAWWSIYLHGAYRHPTQLYASLLEFITLGVVLFVERRNGFSKYYTLPVWMVLHGISRTIMESYRADPRGPTLFGLSISTHISFFLIVIGLSLLSQKYKYNLRQTLKK